MSALPLAASDLSTVAGLIVLVIVGVTKLVAKLARDAKTPPPAGRGARDSMRGAGPPPHPEAEAERTRKFLEALGLPPNTLDPQPGPPPVRTTRPPVRHAPAAPVLPPVLPQAMRGTRESMSHAAPELPRDDRAQIEARRLEKRARKAEQRRHLAPPAPHVASSYESTIERLQRSELKTPEVPAFHTVSSEVSAIPFEQAGSVVAQLYVKEGTARQVELLRLARSPKALRQAILLREILGPPRSLQSDFTAPNLAPL